MHAVYPIGENVFLRPLFSINRPSSGEFSFSPYESPQREKRGGGGRSFFVLVLPAAAAEVKEEGVWFGWSEGERQEVTDGCQAQREGGGFDEGKGSAV